MTGAPDQLAWKVAGRGLTGNVELLTEPLDPRPWEAFVTLARAERLTGLLWDAIAGGAFAVRPGQRDEAAEAHLEAMAAAVLLERVLIEVADALDAAGVEHRVLKGPAVAHLDYPDPQLRPFKDVDLLVRSEQFDEAAAALADGGLRRRSPQPRAHFDRRFGKGACFITAEGFQVDLHRTFVLGPVGLTVDLPAVWSRSASFELGGRTLAALGAEERFLNACLHGVLGDVPPKPLAVRDVAQMLQGNLDLRRVSTVAASSKVGAVVATAVNLASDTLAVADASPASAWASRYVPSRRERRVLAVYRHTATPYPVRAAGAVRAIGGMRGKVAYLRALVLPDSAYLVGRHRTRSGRLSQGLREVLKARRGG